MIDTNKKFNVILIIICAIMICAIFYMIFLINRRESMRNYFDIKDVRGYNWYSKSPEISFNIDGNRATLIIEGEEILTDDRIKLNSETGELVINGKADKSLYIRSIGESNIVLWYEKAEYRLDKEVINR